MGASGCRSQGRSVCCILMGSDGAAAVHDPRGVQRHWTAAWVLAVGGLPLVAASHAGFAACLCCHVLLRVRAVAGGAAWLGATRNQPGGWLGWCCAHKAKLLQHLCTHVLQWRHTHTPTTEQNDSNAGAGVTD